MKQTAIVIVILIASIVVICTMGYKLNEYQTKLDKCQTELDKCQTELKEYQNTLKKMEYTEIHIRNLINRKGLRGYFYDAPIPVQKMLDKKLVSTLAPPLY